MALVLCNKDTFHYGFEVPEKGILRRLVVNLFPEGGVMVISHKYDVSFPFVAVGEGRICHPCLWYITDLWRSFWLLILTEKADVL